MTHRMQYHLLRKLIKTVFAKSGTASSAEAILRDRLESAIPIRSADLGFLPRGESHRAGIVQIKSPNRRSLADGYRRNRLTLALLNYEHAGKEGEQEENF